MMEKSQTYLQRFGKLLFQQVFMEAKIFFCVPATLVGASKLGFFVFCYRDNIQQLGQR